MLTLKSLAVNTLDYSNIEIEWDFESTEENLSDYTISIYRSQSPGVKGEIGGYDEVSTGISANAYSYTDTELHGLRLFKRKWFYKLKITDIRDSSTSVQPNYPAFFHSSPKQLDYIAKEIIRQKKLSLDKKTGRDFYLIKRRTWGEHCPDCWDDTLQRATDPNCSTCDGTGWNNGYFDSIPIKAQKNNSPEMSEINMYGEWKPSDTLIYTLNYPPLNNRDVIVDDQNFRWKIIQVRPINKLGRLIEQQAQAGLINPDDPIYNLTVDFTKEGDIGYE